MTTRETESRHGEKRKLLMLELLVLKTSVNFFISIHGAVTALGSIINQAIEANKSKMVRSVQPPMIDIDDLMLLSLRIKPYGSSIRTQLAHETRS